MVGLTLTEKDGPLVVLAIGAHCDDIEIGCGGTILRLAATVPSLAVHWVVLAAGDAERADEAQASAEAFLTDVPTRRIVLNSFRDAFFPYLGGEVKAFFESLKEGVVPDVVFTHYRDDLHQDHRLASELTWNSFRDHLILEYEIPKYDGDLGSPNVFVPLTEDVARRKIDHLIGCFASQAGKRWFTEDLFLALLRLRGMEANSPSRLAEGFYCRKSVLSL